MATKMKTYCVEFEYRQYVRGKVEAVSKAAAKRVVVNTASNPDFDDMVEYTQSSEPEIEFDACFEDDDS